MGKRGCTMRRRSRPIPASSWPGSQPGSKSGWTAAAEVRRREGEHGCAGAGRGREAGRLLLCTPPDVRLPLIELGIESGAKLIAFEKPVAMTSAEGLAIKQALDGPA